MGGEAEGWKREAVFGEMEEERMLLENETWSSKWKTKVFASPENLTEIYLSFMHGTVSGDLTFFGFFFVFFCPIFSSKAKFP